MSDNVQRILAKLEVYPVHKLSFNILCSCLKSLQESLNINDLNEFTSTDIPILTGLSRLNDIDFHIISNEMKRSIPIKQCQNQVQKLLSQEDRKRFAAFFTRSKGTSFMAQVVAKYIETEKRSQVIIADPFLGSGQTLTEAVGYIGINRIKSVWGIEPVSLSALVAYAALMKQFDGRGSAVNINVGDAFEILSSNGSSRVGYSADVILTNPPFTRGQYLDRDYRRFLLSTVRSLGYGKYLARRDTSLQILSMFLADHILGDKGLLVSVLPASTFYTLSGRGLKKMLGQEYCIHSIVGTDSQTSFSEDSGFKEVILIATKGHTGKNKTLFANLNENTKFLVNELFDVQSRSLHQRVDLNNISRFFYNNWIVFLNDSGLVNIINDLFIQGLESGTLGYWSEILNRGSIIRGVEMYGPEFFFIPNKFWSISGATKKYIEIFNPAERVKLAIDRRYLVRALRKPSLYAMTMTAKVESFMLSLPEVSMARFPSDIQQYIKWGVRSGTASPAIVNYGEYWYSHVHRQMMTKQPFGQLFFPDKVDIKFKRRGVFANFTQDNIAASKNFYIVKNQYIDQTRLLLAWFNSTFFLASLLVLGRNISRTWTRLLINDYMELPVINVKSIAAEKMRDIIDCIDTMVSAELSPFWEQIDSEYRTNMDIAIAKAIGVRDPRSLVKRLYGGLRRWRENN